MPGIASAKKKAVEYDPTPAIRPDQKAVPARPAPGRAQRSFYLYYVTEPRKAIRYGCGVGKAGLEFTGTATIDVKKEWPTWRPTNEMIERDPDRLCPLQGQ